MSFNSPSLNPENEQVQYLQKIALRAENPAAPSVFYYLDTVYFLHEVQFSAAIEAAHFLAETTRPLGRGCLPFSPSFDNSQIRDHVLPGTLEDIILQNHVPLRT